MTQPDIYTIEARRRLAAVERDSGLVENIIKGHAVRHYSDALAATLRELNWQPPVDPDLEEARELAAASYDARGNVDASSLLRTGKWDADSDVQLALAAIKHGRKLERGA